MWTGQSAKIAKSSFSTFDSDLTEETTGDLVRLTHVIHFVKYEIQPTTTCTSCQMSTTQQFRISATLYSCKEFLDF